MLILDLQNQQEGCHNSFFCQLYSFKYALIFFAYFFGKPILPRTSFRVVIRMDGRKESVGILEFNMDFTLFRSSLLFFSSHKKSLLQMDFDPRKE